jgi:uncharacterized membrane protein
MDETKTPIAAAPRPGDKKDIDENKAIAAIGYLWVLCFIPLFAKKDSPFAQFHGKQGFLLFVISVGLWIIGWFPIIGWLISFFGGIALLALAIVGIIKALSGEYWEIPYIGQYAKKFNF